MNYNEKSKQNCLTFEGVDMTDKFGYFRILLDLTLNTNSENKDCGGVLGEWVDTVNVYDFVMANMN